MREIINNKYLEYLTNGGKDLGRDSFEQFYFTFLVNYILEGNSSKTKEWLDREDEKALSILKIKLNQIEL